MQSNSFFSNVVNRFSSQSYLKRTRIDQLLEAAIQKPAITVIAGAGFGKTQAVYSFLQRSDMITVWMQLSSLDNICTHFWEKTVQTLMTHSREISDKMKDLGFPDTKHKINMFISLLTQEGVGGRQYSIVFDDFHLIYEKKILRLIENIISAGTPDVRVILISRSEPEINLTDLFVKDMLCCICEEDLRFDKNEMHQYFEMQGIPIPPQALAAICEQTKGWIFAVRLIELAIKQGVPQEEYAIDAMKQNVFKLMESNFDSQISPRAQRFLVKMSLFHSLPFDLVRRLSGDDRQIVAESLKINAYMRYDSFTNSYCMQYLFLDFLKKKQELLTKHEIADCYRTAAGWYGENGYRIDAINYYGQAGEYDKMQDIVRTFPVQLPKEVSILLLDILGKISEKTFERQPLLGILRVRAMTQIDGKAAALKELEAIKRKFEVQPLTPQSRSVLCEVYIVEAIIHHLSCVDTNDFGFLEYFKKSYEYMPAGSDILWGKSNNHELGTYVCRVSSPRKEDMENYIAAIGAAIPYISVVMEGYMCGMDNLAWVELSYFRSQIKEAEGFAYQALAKAEKNGQYDIELRSCFFLMRIALSLGDYEKITNLFDKVEKHLAERSPSYKIWCDIFYSWFYSAVGRGDQAASWIKSNFVKSNVGLMIFGSGNLATMKYYLSEKRYDDLLAFSENEENTNEFASFLLGKIALLIYQAVCMYHIGEQDKAISRLQRAYELSLPNGLTMQFIEMGNEMVALTKLALKSPTCAIPQEWLKNIFRKSSTYAKRLSYIATEYKKATRPTSKLQCKLTKKELECLTGFCRGMSIAEIALQHNVSKNYINNRMQTIYAKLGAQNIKEAIHIATLMELVK